MNTSSRVLVLTVALLLCHCLSEVECRRTTSTSRRGQSSRRNNYGSSSQGSTGNTGFFSSFFGSKKPSGSSGSSGSSTASKKTGTGWTSAGQPSRTSGTSSGQSGSWANPYYKPSAPPKQTGTYGWVPGGSAQQTNQFQRSGQPSSNIGSGGYPVQSGFKPATQSHGYNTAQQPHGYNTAQQPHGYNTAQQSHGYNTAQQPHGYNTAQQPHGYNTAQQPHSYNTAQQPHGYNTGQQPYGFNPGQQSHGYAGQPSYGHNPPSYSQPSYHGSNVGGYHPSPNVAPQGFASSHGISPNYYPSQSNFGYPGQGLFGGSHGPKYGGLSLFNSGSGSYGYGSNNWGVPSYGSKSSSGTGKLLTGLALGAAGGYLTSSLVNRVSSPWGYSGWGYGNRYGYDRPIVIKEIRETTKTSEPAVQPAPEPDPRDNWINCVAFDPAINQTFINPNCSCTVTTTVDPMTGLPISTHNCTTANGQVLPPVPFGGAPQMSMGPQPPMEMLPPNAVNNPNATPNYGGLYNDNMRYGAAPEAMAPMSVANVENISPPAESTSPPPANASPSPSTSETPSTTSDPETSSSTTENMMADSPKELHYINNPKVKEFYSKLEQITNMGKFN